MVRTCQAAARLCKTENKAYTNMLNNVLCRERIKICFWRYLALSLALRKSVKSSTTRLEVGLCTLKVPTNSYSLSQAEKQNIGSFLASQKDLYARSRNQMRGIARRQMSLRRYTEGFI